jgi:CxxC motif-containing protein
MKKEFICIVCPQGCRLTVEEKDGNYQVTGNTCKRGEEYGINEMTAPKRVITSTVKLVGGHYPRLPVKTDGEVPKELIFDCMTEINHITVISPVQMGDVVLQNVLGTGVNVVATRTL